MIQWRKTKKGHILYEVAMRLIQDIASDIAANLARDDPELFTCRRTKMKSWYSVDLYSKFSVGISDRFFDDVIAFIAWSVRDRDRHISSSRHLNVVITIHDQFRDHLPWSTWSNTVIIFQQSFHRCWLVNSQASESWYPADFPLQDLQRSTPLISSQLSGEVHPSTANAGVTLRVDFPPFMPSRVAQSSANQSPSCCGDVVNACTCSREG